MHISLGKPQFYWRMTDAPNIPQNPVPDFVDFEFSFLEECQLIIQTRNAQTWRYLETVYRENYNVGYLQEGHALADSYGNDFIKCITDAIARHRPTTRRVSEIGAGGCWVLKQLRDRGYEVAAIDPSPIAIRKGEELGIEVIPEFYPAGRAIPRSDVVIHYDVLEHVTDPVGFLRHHRRDLHPGGLLVAAVPDCTPYIERGDISMILHEHLNYYDHESLANVASAAGFEVLEVIKGGYGGVLYCVARARAEEQPWQPRSGVAKFSRWGEGVQRLRTEVDAFLDEGMRDGHTLGCYVPLRATPYLALRGFTRGLRFFDDDPGIHHRYFDGFPIAVENMADLIARPVTHLLILSFAFGDKIRSRIDAGLPGHSIAIRCLSDFDVHKHARA
jgi:SAM-dependent methyltransferase